MTDKTLTKEELTRQLEEMVVKVSDDGWNNIIIEGLPKPMRAEALTKIAEDAIEHAFGLMAQATGVTYIRGHRVVQESDCETAVNIQTAEIEEILPIPDGTNYR